jgi:hypothetical protein
MRDRDKCEQPGGVAGGGRERLGRRVSRETHEANHQGRGLASYDQPIQAALRPAPAHPASARYRPVALAKVTLILWVSGHSV